MFIILQIYRTKLVWNDFCFTALRANVFTDLNKSVNQKYFVYKKTYFDVGKESISKVRYIYWWKTYYLQDWLASMDLKTYVVSRLYPVASTQDTIAMNIQPL